MLLKVHVQERKNEIYACCSVMAIITFRRRQTVAAIGAGISACIE
jgi:hypothetical protein